MTRPILAISATRNLTWAAWADRLVSVGCLRSCSMPTHWYASVPELDKIARALDNVRQVGAWATVAKPRVVILRNKQGPDSRSNARVMRHVGLLEMFLPLRQLVTFAEWVLPPDAKMAVTSKRPRGAEWATALNMLGYEHNEIFGGADPQMLCTISAVHWARQSTHPPAHPTGS